MDCVIKRLLYIAGAYHDIFVTNVYQGTYVFVQKNVNTFNMVPVKRGNHKTSFIFYSINLTGTFWNHHGEIILWVPHKRCFYTQVTKNNSFQITSVFNFPWFMNFIWSYEFYLQLPQNNYITGTTVTDTLRKHTYSNILKISPPKTGSFQIKFWSFSHFCSKHRLWVLIRNTLVRWFWRSTHNLCFWAQIRNNNVYPCKPQFYYII